MKKHESMTEMDMKKLKPTQVTAEENPVNTVSADTSEPNKFDKFKYGSNKAPSIDFGRKETSGSISSKTVVIIIYITTGS